jgi:hypothetical protein
MENRKQFSVRSIKHIGDENSNIFKTNQNIKKKFLGVPGFLERFTNFPYFKKNKHFFSFSVKKSWKLATELAHFWSTRHVRATNTKVKKYKLNENV